MNCHMNRRAHMNCRSNTCNAHKLRALIVMAKIDQTYAINNELSVNQKLQLRTTLCFAKYELKPHNSEGKRASSKHKAVLREIIALYEIRTLIKGIRLKTRNLICEMNIKLETVISVF